jgi:hypothetical protein
MEDTKVKTFIKSLAIAALSIATLMPAAAIEDETPYKEDGPRRTFFVQSWIRSCEQQPVWIKMAANQKETTAFCTCKALFLADIWTTEDELEWVRAHQSYTKLPAETHDKWEQAELSCQKHFSKLPKVPARSKKD